MWHVAERLKLNKEENTLTEIIVVLVLIAFLTLEFICVYLIRIYEDMKTVYSCANKKTLRHLKKSVK